MPPRGGRWGWFWGTPIETVSGRLFRFYGLTIARIGIGVLTHQKPVNGDLLRRTLVAVKGESK